MVEMKDSLLVVLTADWSVWQRGIEQAGQMVE